MQHEATCRAQTSTYTMQLSPTAGVETGTEMVPMQIKVRHEYGSPTSGYATVTSAADAATCNAIVVGADASANIAACTAATQCVYTPDDLITPASEEACTGGDACTAARMDGESCYAADAVGCAAVALNGTTVTARQTACTGAAGLSCAYTAANLHIGVAEACYGVKSAVCAAVTLDGTSATCENEAGCTHRTNQQVCTAASMCTYTPDNPATATDEKICAASGYEVPVPVVAEGCVATDVAACTAVVPGGDPLACANAAVDGVAIACDYIPANGAVAEACTASRSATCAAIKLNGYPATCTGVPGCSHVPASGSTAFTTVERTILSMGSASGFMVSDMNITMTPTTALAIRDVTGALDLVSVDTSAAGSEAVAVHAPKVSLHAATWPNDGGEGCSSVVLVETCAPVNSTYAVACGVVVPDGNPSTCTNVPGCTHHPAPMESAQASCEGAGSCVYVSNPQSCKPQCDPCACDLDGVVNGYDTGRPSCVAHYASDPAGAAAIGLPFTYTPMCMVHPDCSLAVNVTIDHAGGPSLPYRLCTIGADNFAATDCSDPADALSMPEGWNDETEKHGAMDLTASKLAMSRTVVNYMMGRKSRALANVLSFSNDGALELGGTATALTTSESFTIYTPATVSTLACAPAAVL
jgi:hypothetical protein